VLRKIFGPMKDEVTGEWRRLNNEELYDLYSSPYIVRIIKSTRMKWAEHVVSIYDSRNVYRALVRKPEITRQLGRRRCRSKDNIKKDLEEEGRGGLDWIALGQDRDSWRSLVNATINIRVL
jgi:hypothetical protein